MTLIDTSAWIEFLRGTGSPANVHLADLLRSEQPVHTTDVVVMEVLAGGRDAARTAELKRLLKRCEFVPTGGLADFEQAALLYQQCRSAGRTVRALTDCLIAAVALRSGLDVLHLDRDFDALAQCTGLRLYSPGSATRPPPA